LSDTAVLRVHRDFLAWKDRYRKYRVVLDGVEVARLRNGESTSLAVSPGGHTLRIKIDWCGSPEQAFHVGSGDEIDFCCWNAASLAKPFDQLAKLIWDRNRYIALERDAGTGPSPAG
jgi:hypothetical protein